MSGLSKSGMSVPVPGWAVTRSQTSAEWIMIGGVSLDSSSAWSVRAAAINPSASSSKPDLIEIDRGSPLINERSCFASLPRPAVNNPSGSSGLVDLLKSFHHFSRVMASRGCKSSCSEIQMCALGASWSHSSRSSASRAFTSLNEPSACFLLTHFSLFLHRRGVTKMKASSGDAVFLRLL